MASEGKLDATILRSNSSAWKIIQMTGCNNKRRFSLKFPDGHIERFGSCDPKDDDNRDIVNGKLVHLNIEGIALIGEPLPEGTLWTNGYYDKEHDGWKRLSDWV